jgi:hypothetical protein
MLQYTDVGLGNLNMTSRDLVCLPPELFDIHLGITPEPLPGVDTPAPLPESTRRKPAGAVSWYEQVDLAVLKAPDNAITALQPELIMFGSLKVIDVCGVSLQIPEYILTSTSSYTRISSQPSRPHSQT